MKRNFLNCYFSNILYRMAIIMYNIGIDLGGTNIVAGVVDDSCSIIGKGKCKTSLPRSAEEIFDDMGSAVNNALKEAAITLDDVYSIGLGTPGAVDEKDGVITFSANLKFHNVRAVNMLKERFDKKIFIGNDANCAAFGEFLAGAGKNSSIRDMIAVTLGTGVGSGIIIDGRILTGFNGAAGELGHMVIQVNGVSCNCGRKGCWETYASASGLIRMTKELYEKTGDPAIKEAVEAEGEINAKIAYMAARSGSKNCADLIDKYAFYVACGLTNIINAFEPQVVCIGGGVSHEGDALLTPVKKYVAEESYTKNNPLDEQTVIRLAELGNDAGIIGAAMLYKNYENELR